MALIDWNYLGRLLLCMFCTQYSVFFFSLFNKNKREDVKKGNEELNRIRSIPIKTIEEQKAFLDIRFPNNSSNKYKTKFSWIGFFKNLFKYGLIGYIFYRLIPTDTSVWISLTIVFTAPIVINYILRKFSLEKPHPLSDMFR